MKKSKIIVPALGLLLLSTAASVSGSVAWFTANRTFNTEIGSFAVTKLDGDLSCAFTAGVGTSLEASSNANIRDSAGNVLVVETDGTANLLGDASFDHTSGKLYTDNPDETTEAGVNTDNFLDLGLSSSGNWEVADNVYYAVQWTMTFTYTYGANPSAVGLFFDVAHSSATGSTAGTDAAFRIAFVTSDDAIVWAPKQAQLSTIQKYVSGEDEMTSYDADELICSGETINPNADGVASTSDEDYLGSFATGSTTATVAVTCTAWYEGTYCENSMSLSSLTAGLAFYTRRLAA